MTAQQRYSCELSGVCGSDTRIKVNIEDMTYCDTDGNCDDSNCSRTDVLSATATVTKFNNSATCPGNRTVAVCRYWVKLSAIPQTIYNFTCTIESMPPPPDAGSVVTVTLTAQPNALGDYAFRIFASDITGSTGSGCTCAGGACDPANCDTNCDAEIASDGSCTMHLP